jgi:hypothetical protein
MNDDRQPGFLIALGAGYALFLVALLAMAWSPSFPWLGITPNDASMPSGHRMFVTEID